MQPQQMQQMQPQMQPQMQQMQPQQMQQMQQGGQQDPSLSFPLTLPTGGALPRFIQGDGVLSTPIPGMGPVIAVATDLSAMAQMGLEQSAGVRRIRRYPQMGAAPTFSSVMPSDAPSMGGKSQMINITKLE